MALLTATQIKTIQGYAKDIARHRVATGKVLKSLYFTIDERGGIWHIRGIYEDKVHHYKREFFFSKRNTKALANRQCNAANLRLSMEIDSYKRDFKAMLSK